MQWLELFHQKGDAVFYGTISSSTDHTDLLDNLVKDIVEIDLNNDSFNQVVKKINPSIVIYDRFTSEEQFGWRVREEIPNATHILETQDLHFLRESRQKNISIFNDITKREIASILRCDLTSIISEYELQLLKDSFPFVSNQIFYFPLYYDGRSEIKSLEGRKDFCFIGNLQHAPNIDAVLFLKKSWKEIREKLPTVNIHIYGAYLHQRISQLHDAKNGFIIHGRAETVEEVFTKHKVLLAPMQFGAGLKGKLLEAMQYGIVSVTTPIGSEGISSAEYWNGSVVSLENFAKTSIETYREDSNYETYQQQGLHILQNKFDAMIYLESIYSLIESVSKDLNQWRNQHFLTDILNHHRQQSVRYLSKWIALKNENR